MNPLDAIGAFVGNLTGAAAWIGNRHNIVRIAYGVIGVAAIVAGSFMLAGESTGPTVGKIVKGVR